jgi:hypothetical protein
MVEFTFVLLDYLIIQAVASRTRKFVRKLVHREHRQIDREHNVEHHGEKKSDLPPSESLLLPTDND